MSGSGKQFLSGSGIKRSTFFEVADPNLIKVVGLDKEALKTKYPQWYRPSAVQPPDERMVKSFMRRGMRKAVEVFRDPKTNVLVCVDGVCRLLAMREAHKRIKVKGLEFAPAVKAVKWDAPSYARQDPIEQALDVIDANIHAERSPREIAAHCQHLKQLGASLEQIAEAFGWASTQTVRNYLAILDVPECVGERLDKGEMSTTVARELAGLTEVEAKKALEVLDAGAQGRANGSDHAAGGHGGGGGKPLKGTKAVRAARAATGRPPIRQAKRTSLRPRIEIEERWKEWKGQKGQIAHAVANTLAWVLGRDVEVIASAQSTS